MQNFRIDIDENSMETVLLGQNASGKSNFLEALILIFKHLDLETPVRKIPNAERFDYFIKYECRKKNIEVVFENNSFQFKIDEVEVKPKQFFDNKKEYLPRFIFNYYSGYNDRIERLFWEHQAKYYQKAISDDSTSAEREFRRLFRFNPEVHSRMAALSFFAFQEEEQKSIDFLRDVLRLEKLESVLLVLERPDWSSNKDRKDRFWGAKGLVRAFLDTVWNFSLAPIYNSESIDLDFRRKTTKERLYLFISDVEKLKKLSLYFNDNLQLFQALESTYISSMIDEIRVRVKKTGAENLAYRDLSEGEQQLLGVLGAINFTKGEESLILLDEPDTHLNPLWKWQYLKYLRQFVEYPDSTQIIINTHDPLVIGGLTKEQVCIFRTNKESGLSEVEYPHIDPKGLGVAGILTSEFFGLPTTLDEETQKLLNRKRSLQGRLMGDEQLSEIERKELKELTEWLEEKGFYDITSDQTYNEFLKVYSQHPLFEKVVLNDEEKKIVESSRHEILSQILTDQNFNIV